MLASFQIEEEVCHTTQRFCGDDRGQIAWKESRKQSFETSRGHFPRFSSSDQVFELVVGSLHSTRAVIGVGGPCRGLLQGCDRIDNRCLINKFVDWYAVAGANRGDCPGRPQFAHHTCSLEFVSREVGDPRDELEIASVPTADVLFALDLAASTFFVSLPCGTDLFIVEHDVSLESPSNVLAAIVG